MHPATVSRHDSPAAAATQAGVLPLHATSENAGDKLSESEDEHSSIDYLSPEELRRRLRIANGHKRTRDFKAESMRQHKKDAERKEKRKQQNRKRRENSSSEPSASSDEQDDRKRASFTIKKSELSIAALNFSQNFEAENIDKYALWADDVENDILKALGKEGKAVWARLMKNANLRSSTFSDFKPHEKYE